jgi:hypothetical protein
MLLQGLIILLLGVVGGLGLVITSIFTRIQPEYGIGIFLLSILISTLLFTIGKFFSNIDKFTENFITEIETELSKAKTTEDLYKVYDKICSEAIDEKNMIRLSNPYRIRELLKLLKEINYKIDILNKQDVKIS